MDAHAFSNTFVQQTCWKGDRQRLRSLSRVRKWRPSTWQTLRPTMLERCSRPLRISMPAALAHKSLV
eukprot:1323852-Pyramimonas_sp.AAC.1